MNLSTIDDHIKFYRNIVSEVPLSQPTGEPFEPEEERKLIKAWHDHRDNRARAALVMGFAPLIEGIARGYRSDGMADDDKIQLGRIGLLRALDKFDLSKPFRFSTYARCPPEQISGWLKRQFPTDQGMRVSYETIYRSLLYSDTRRAEEGADGAPAYSAADAPS